MVRTVHAFGLLFIRLCVCERESEHELATFNNVFCHL